MDNCSWPAAYTGAFLWLTRDLAIDPRIRFKSWFDFVNVSYSGDRTPMIRRFPVLIFSSWALLFLAALVVAAPQDVKSVAPPAVVAAATNDVVLRVLGESVTEKQVLDTINQVMAQVSRTQKLTSEQVQKKDTLFYKEALDTIVGTILLKNEAKANNIVVDKAKIDDNLKAMKAQFPDEAKFQEALKTQGMTEESLRNSIETNLMCQQMLDQVLKDVPPASDADIQKFYDENPKYFQAPAVHAAQIFMRVDRNATPDQKSEIRKKLEALRASIESKSVTFDAAAKSNSDDKDSAPKGGDMGLIQRGMLIKPLEDAVFAAPPNTLTPVIETEFGYNLLYVFERTQAKAPLDTALTARIKTYLENKSKQDVTLKHLEALKAKNPVETLISDEEWNKRHGAK